jgi:hypothetical protein
MAVGAKSVAHIRDGWMGVERGDMGGSAESGLARGR